MCNLCYCNNCEKVLIDHNPQVKAVQFDVNGELQETIHLKTDDEGEEGPLWACPFCKTDGYLVDIDKDNIHLVEGIATLSE